jgi:hypothetical protein
MFLGAGRWRVWTFRQFTVGKTVLQMAGLVLPPVCCWKDGLMLQGWFTADVQPPVVNGEAGMGLIAKLTPTDPIFACLWFQDIQALGDNILSGMPGDDFHMKLEMIPGTEQLLNVSHRRQSGSRPPAALSILASLSVPI